MKRAPRLDGNHADVVKALTEAGMTVQSLASVGSGCPDTVVGWRGVNTLLEIKWARSEEERRLTGVGTKTPLTEAELDWHATWGGQIAVVRTPQEAVDAVIAHVRACGVL